MAPFGIVAALRSEVAPSLRDLKASIIVCGGLPCYETPGFRLILSGVGARRADSAARLLADLDLGLDRGERVADLVRHARGHEA